MVKQERYYNLVLPIAACGQVFSEERGARMPLFCRRNRLRDGKHHEHGCLAGEWSWALNPEISISSPIGACPALPHVLLNVVSKDQAWAPLELSRGEENRMLGRGEWSGN